MENKKIAKKNAKIENEVVEVQVDAEAPKPRDKTLNIYERLLNCMRDVNYIQKTSGKNNLKYTFASHDNVTAKCTEAFVTNGVYPEVVIEDDRLEKILVHKEKVGYNGSPATITDSDNYMSYIKLKIKFVNVDNPSDVAFGEGVGQGIDDQDKACGKAMSYAYKYCLLKALGIKTGDDPENDVDFSIGRGAAAKPSDSDKKPELPKQDVQLENAKLADRLIARINGMGSASELQGWLEDKSVIKAYANLQKVSVAQYDRIKKAELAKFQELDPV